MAEETQGSADPSMEEILASIRKIISDDAPPELVQPAPAVEDVVELTQMVQDDGTVVDLSAAPAPEPVVAAAPPPPPPPPAPPPPPPPPAAVHPIEMPSEPLAAEPVVETASSSLTNLANTVEIERRASIPPLTTTLLGNGARTLEDMTIELMRPMLKQWLDENLPAVVDRLVQKEIERISRRN